MSDERRDREEGDSLFEASASGERGDAAWGSHPFFEERRDFRQHRPGAATSNLWLVAFLVTLGVLVLVLLGQAGFSPLDIPRFASSLLESRLAGSQEDTFPDSLRGREKGGDTEVGGPQGRPGSTGLDGFHASGRYIVFRNPAGYCTLGDSLRERSLLDFAKRPLPKDVRLAHFAIDCNELEEFKAGERDELDHWIQIQQLGPQDGPLEMSRERFLEQVAAESPELNESEVTRHAQVALREVWMSDFRYEPIGRDGKAAYFSIGVKLSFGGKDRLINGLSGYTLVKDIPMTVNVYEGRGTHESRERVNAALQALLTSLLASN